MSCGSLLEMTRECLLHLLAEGLTGASVKCMMVAEFRMLPNMTLITLFLSQAILLTSECHKKVGAKFARCSFEYWSVYTTWTSSRSPRQGTEVVACL